MILNMHPVDSEIREDTRRLFLTDVLHTNIIFQTTNRRLLALSPCLWQLFHSLINTSTLIVGLLPPPPPPSASLPFRHYLLFYFHISLSVSSSVCLWSLYNKSWSVFRPREFLVSRRPNLRTIPRTSEVVRKPRHITNVILSQQICDYTSHVSVMRYVNTIFTRYSTAH